MATILRTVLFARSTSALAPSPHSLPDSLVISCGQCCRCRSTRSQVDLDLGWNPGLMRSTEWGLKCCRRPIRLISARARFVAARRDFGRRGVWDRHCDAGFKMATLMSRYVIGLSPFRRDKINWLCNNNVHPSRHGTYDGISFHPFETIFVKSSILMARVRSLHKAVRLMAEVITSSFACVIFPVCFLKSLLF